MNIIKEKIINIFGNEKQVKRNTCIQIFFVTLLCIIILAYPAGLQKEYFYSRQKAFDMPLSDEYVKEPFGSNDKKLQKVYFSRDHIYQIKLYVSCILNDDEEKVLFALYDDAFSCIYIEKCDVNMVDNAGYLLVSPDLDVIPGREYYYEMLVPEDVTTEFFLPTAPKSALAQEENSTLYVDGIIDDESCLIADFCYSRDRAGAEIAAHCLFIVLAVIFVYILIMYALCIYDNGLLKYEHEIKKYARYVLSIIICIAVAFAITYSVFLNKFGVSWLDRLFFAAAAVMGGVWLMAMVWVPYFYPTEKKESKLSAGRQVSLIWRNYIQIVSFSLLFYALCQYVNADREFYHTINTRWALIFMAISLLMMYNEKQLFNILNFIWLGVSITVSYLYCGWVVMEEEELLIAKLTCGVVVAWGLLLINILLQLRLRELTASLKQLKAWQLIFGALWIAFAVLMYLYRFEKTWMYTAVLPFAAMFFMRFDDAKRNRFIKNLTDGTILSFGLVTFFCLMHRPYHYWMLYRYGGIFHTVACTGMYLAVVLGAAVSKLFGKLSRNNNIICCHNELLLTAAVAGFIVLTISRTAFLTSAAVVVLVILLTAYTYRKGLKWALAGGGALFAACACCFPLVYSAVRTVPAVVGNPVRYNLEPQDNSYMICSWDPINSDKYMTVRRFFSVFLGRFENTGSDTDDNAEAAGINIVGDSDLIAYSGKDFKDLGILYFDDNEDSDEDTGTEEKENDISNGRFKIYQDYLSGLSFSGHPKMDFVDEQGIGHYGHAHNSYIQVAHDFGIIAGVIFLVICAFTLIRAVRLMYLKGGTYPIYLTPFAFAVVFCFVSITEWAFHPCIPVGFCFLIVQPMLMRE